MGLITAGYLISKSDADSFYSFCVDADNYVGKSLINAICEPGKTKEHFVLLILIALIKLKKSLFSKRFLDGTDQKSAQQVCGGNVRYCVAPTNACKLRSKRFCLEKAKMLTMTCRQWQSLFLRVLS